MCDSSDDERPLAERLTARQDNDTPVAGACKRVPVAAVATRKRPLPAEAPSPRRRSRRQQPESFPNICYAPMQRAIELNGDGAAHGARALLSNLALGAANGLPSHAQHTEAHCTPYALWNAAEVVLGHALARPAFIDMKVRKVGMSAGLSMERLLERRDAVRFLRDHKLRAERVEVHGRGKHAPILLKALQSGVLLVGGTVGMATYHSVHHRGGREPRSWQGCRIPGFMREGHSFVVVGSALVADELGRSLIVRDSQDEAVFGINGCAILPLKHFEGELSECHVLCAV